VLIKKIFFLAVLLILLFFISLLCQSLHTTAHNIQGISVYRGLQKARFGLAITLYCDLNSESRRGGRAGAGEQWEVVSHFSINPNLKKKSLIPL
jgi:hypothetical protein